MNLKYFLQFIWTLRGITDDETPVDAIVPVISEDDEIELSTFGKKKLFIIQGKLSQCKNVANRPVLPLDGYRYLSL